MLLGRIKKLFINERETRLRGAWRIGIQKLIRFILLIIFLIVANKFDSVFNNLNLLTFDDFSFTSIGGLVTILVISLSSLISVFIAIKFIDKRNLSKLGISLNKEWIINFSFGFVIKAIIVGLLFLVELKIDLLSIKEISFNEVKIFLGFLICAFIGIREEVLFRGYLLINLSESFNIKKYISSKGAIILAGILLSMFFGLGHIDSGSDISKLVFASHFVSGIVYSLVYILTESLSLPIAMHISHNFFSGIIFGHFDAVPLINIKLNIGSNVSMLGGVMNIINIILTGIVVLLWIKIRYGALQISTSLAEYK